MPAHAEVHDMSYYSKCMVGGILSCGLTHTLICPLDIIKCRKQVALFLRFHVYPNTLRYRLILLSIKAFLMASRLSTELKE